MPISQSLNPSVFGSKKSHDFELGAHVVKTEGSGRAGIGTPSENDIYTKINNPSDQLRLRTYGGSNSGSVDE